MRIAVDSGGTFTDCVWVEGCELRVLKVPSTPGEPGRALLEAVRRIAGTESMPGVRHGTTVGTNAMLERTGARVAYVTTAGFEDVIAIGRQARPSLYDWMRSPLPCLVPPELRFGVPERVSAEGVVLRAPTDEELAKLCAQVRASGAEAVAVSLLFGFANPVNERRIASALGELALPVSVSHEILPEFREYERGATVVVNAYLQPKVGSYLRTLEDGVRESFAGGTVSVMQSSGGIVSAGLAAREPVRTVLSGPAGGVLGAWRIGQICGFKKMIGFDMGGTSTDVSLIDTDAGLRTTREAVVSEVPVGVPMLEIHTVGAGGGSLARWDAGGLLQVGPESAGAVPGPACYGVGERATVTDANLLLGRMDAERFLGGGKRLDKARARRVLEAMRGEFESVEAFAEGIVRLAEAAMEKAIRVISVERGYDPREFTLVSFGGAGPLHACLLARALRIPRVLVPVMPGALSALGILMADVVREYSWTVMVEAAAALEGYFEELVARGMTEFAGERQTQIPSGNDKQEKQGQAQICFENGGQEERERLIVERTADLRYVGQGYELNVAAGLEMVEAFHQAHRQRYGYASETLAVEVVNVRVRMTARTKPVELPRHPERAGDGGQAAVGARAMYFDGAWHDSRVYARELLMAGDRFCGPAMVTEYSATTVLPTGSEAYVDGWGNLVVEVGA